MVGDSGPRRRGQNQNSGPRPEPEPITTKIDLVDLEEKLQLKRSPLKRLAIFAAGGNKQLLHKVPSEQNVLAVVGTTVMLTAFIAASAATIAASYLMYGSIKINVATATAGLVWGLIIFLVDRSLVKAPLNPFRFPPEVIAAIWNPEADQKWADAARRNQNARSPLRFSGEASAVFVKALPRIALALAASYVFAEIMLFGLFFKSEVDTRVVQIFQDQVNQEISSENTSYASAQKSFTNSIAANQKQISDNNAQLSVLSDVSKNPEVIAAQAAVDTERPNNDRLTSLSTDWSRLASDECGGYDTTVQPADSATPIKTSGLASQQLPDGSWTGEKCREYQNHYSLVKEQLRIESEIFTGLQNGLTKAQSAAGGDPIGTRAKLQGANDKLVASNATLQTQLDALDQPHSDRLAILIAKRDGTQLVPGIAIRRQALDQLETDEDPSTFAIDPIPTCGGSVSGWLCSVKNSWFPPTPVGPFVGAVRLSLLAFELLPLILKIAFSLRGRRPYDALEAAIEELSYAKSVEFLDVHLNQIGARRESRAAWRRSQRVGSGAEYLLQLYDGHSTDDIRDANALEAELIRSFAKRRRFWSRRARAAIRVQQTESRHSSPAVDPPPATPRAEASLRSGGGEPSPERPPWIDPRWEENPPSPDRKRR